jgi:hypothetical protein
MPRYVAEIEKRSRYTVEFEATDDKAAKTIASKIALPEEADSSDETLLSVEPAEQVAG